VAILRKRTDRPTLVMVVASGSLPAGMSEWSLITSSFRHPASDALASFKTTSKILHVMAAPRRRKKARTKRCC